MSKLKGYLALIILVISWVALYWLTGSRTPWQEFAAGTGDKGISIHLGDIPRIVGYLRIWILINKIQPRF